MKHNLQSLLLSGLTAATLFASLSACAPLIVGGAVMSSLVAIDRRTTGIQLEDEGIELRTAQGLRQNLGDSAHVNVTSYNRMVLLTGEVGNAADRDRAEKMAQSQENVKSVVNDLVIEPVLMEMLPARDPARPNAISVCCLSRPSILQAAAVAPKVPVVPGL